MGYIQILDHHLSNMIAAGEVVERPASVVKELVENAIDAEAKKIEVHIEDGGLATIRIVDDGIGMDREDSVQAFERHATSKIKKARDLFHIRSLGFRGEALPSIASVSRLELLSSQDSGQVGTRVFMDGGQVKSTEDHARVKGTEIIVRDLFFNTPARLKYMRSISTEVGHISDYVNRLALTYPNISFTLSHNGKTLLSTSGDGKLLHVMAAIYGVQVAKMLLPFEGENLDFRWHGLLSKTEITRANRSYITTLVNGRYVRNYALSQAVMRGYHTLLPIGRFPIAVLHLEMDPILVDVNVHPAKLEVRFSKEKELAGTIENAVKQTLQQGLGIFQPMKVASSKPKILMQKPYQPQFDLGGRSERTLFSSDSEGDVGLTAFDKPGLSHTPSTSVIRETIENIDEKSPELIKEGQTYESTQTMTQWKPSTDNERVFFARETPGEKEGRVLSDDREDEFGTNKMTEELDSNVQSSDVLSEVSSSNWDDTEINVGAVEGQQDNKELPHQVIDSTLHDESQPELTEDQQQGVPMFYPIGQVHGTYIIAQNDTGMYLIDQHAAQERIFYEYFMRKLEEADISSQMLLFPHTVECT
ncbi:DNA mismatch repair endonuclease MutL, partial [Brevibacillus daliensis]|uniref:DNA mismatch repair endonuclease MutL n=1 Tax=Brevibacillus daliensis TaxID=2892995 RepID=UPI001E640B9E